MSTRQQRRYEHEKIRKIGEMTPEQRRREGDRLLQDWKAEARRRSDDLKKPPVWTLMESKAELLRLCDPTGELASELSRVCAEAVSRVGGRHMVGVSRPLADRSRLHDHAR